MPLINDHRITFIKGIFQDTIKEMEKYTGKKWFLSFVHKIVQREKYIN